MELPHTSTFISECLELKIEPGSPIFQYLAKQFVITLSSEAEELLKDLYFNKIVQISKNGDELTGFCRYCNSLRNPNYKDIRDTFFKTFNFDLNTIDIDDMDKGRLSSIKAHRDLAAHNVKTSVPLSPLDFERHKQSYEIILKKLEESLNTHIKALNSSK